MNHSEQTTHPGEGWRWLLTDEPRRAGDEVYDVEKMRWLPIRTYWRSQFGNGNQQPERRRCRLRHEFDALKRVWHVADPYRIIGSIEPNPAGCWDAILPGFDQQHYTTPTYWHAVAIIETAYENLNKK